MSIQRKIAIVFIAAALFIASVAIQSLLPVPVAAESSFIPLVPSRFGNEFEISSGNMDDYHPVVAYNTWNGEYLVVWHTSLSGSRRYIVVNRVSKTGQLLDSPVAVSITGVSSFAPAVAYNNDKDEYLIVWMTDPDGSGAAYEIWGRICQLRPSNPGCTGNDFHIAHWANRSFWDPSIAYNSFRKEYLVVWNALDTNTGLPSDVAGYRLTDAGAVINPGSPIIISDLSNPHQASVDHNPAYDEYLVVWRQMYTASDGDIYGRRMQWNGTFAAPAFPISAASEDQQNPAVSSCATYQYLVVWQHAAPGPCCDWEIWGREMEANGNMLEQAKAIAESPDDELYPTVAGLGLSSDFLVAWQRSTTLGETIRAASWDGNFTNLEVASAAFWDNEKPAVAAGGGSGYLFVYESDSSGDPGVIRHIYGRLWWPATLYLPLVLR